MELYKSDTVAEHHVLSSRLTDDLRLVKRSSLATIADRRRQEIGNDSLDYALNKLCIKCFVRFRLLTIM